MAERYSCVRASSARGDPLVATASVVTRWVMVEQPGPWGRDAVTDSRLPGSVAAALNERAAALRIRTILLRRHGGGGRGPADDGPARCYVAATGEGRRWAEEVAVDRPDDLLGLDLAALARGESVGGVEVTHPLYLVCTNGRHDPCCAEFGRPLAAALERLRTPWVWECSHIGGDRFAANLLCFPHGLYYGRVTPDEAATVVEAYEAGRVHLPRYRGRAGLPFPVQAAEQALRSHQRLDGVDAVEAVRWERPRDGRARVVLSERGGPRWVVDLAVRRADSAWELTCRAAVPGSPPRYEVVALNREG